MKKTEIKAGTSYTNKSGRSERLVLDVGPHVHVRWLGSDSTEPTGEDGVLFVDTRMGKTIYGEGSGKRATSMYVSAFSSWAARAVPDGKDAVRYSYSATQMMIEKARK